MVADSKTADDYRVVECESCGRLDVVLFPCGYCGSTTRRAKTLPLVRTGQGEFTRDYDPAPPAPIDWTRFYVALSFIAGAAAGAAVMVIAT